MLLPSLSSGRKLAEKISAYFYRINGGYHFEIVAEKEQKIYDREPEAATITGLALFLGFNSRQEFEDYEQTGKWGDTLKKARLQVEAIYEQKLHQPSPSGAIFALKNLGWGEKSEDKVSIYQTSQNIRVEIVETGLKLVSSENDVEM
jgi:hypothetical protein